MFTAPLLSNQQHANASHISLRPIHLTEPLLVARDIDSCDGSTFAFVSPSCLVNSRKIELASYKEETVVGGTRMAEMIDFCLGYLVNSCYPINRGKQMARTKYQSQSRSAICVNLKLIFTSCCYPRPLDGWLIASNDLLTQSFTAPVGRPKKINLMIQKMGKWYRKPQWIAYNFKSSPWPCQLVIG